MANSNSSKASSSNSKSNPNRSSNRANPMIPKAGYTKSGRRSFGNGGKV